MNPAVAALEAIADALAASGLSIQCQYQFLIRLYAAQDQAWLDALARLEHEINERNEHVSEARTMARIARLADRRVA